MVPSKNSSKKVQSVRTAVTSSRIDGYTGSIGTAVSVVPSSGHVLTTLQKSSKSDKVSETSDVSNSNTETMDTQNDTLMETDTAPQPKLLVWRDIHAEVVTEKKLFGRLRGLNNEPNRVVLDGVSGCANPGQITFLMGSSGAGKTTLLNILTQQTKGLNIYGEVAVNKHVMEPGEMRRLSAYVQQEDLFIGELTVKETLMLNAYLRMPANCTKQKRRAQLDHVASEMGLEPCLNTKIGTTTEKSISKGEKKRLAFACELVTDPHILFCDEPTSGLDSFMALQVIRALKTLAHEGKTIICSIHQPSSQVYELADRLVLMGSGRIAYQGPASYIGEYFASIQYPCPRFISVTDHFLKVLSHDPEKEEDDQYRKRIEHILENYSKSELAKETHQITHEETTPSKKEMEDLDEKPEYAAPWFTQFYWLLWRGIMCILRNPMILRLRTFQTFNLTSHDPFGEISSIFRYSNLHHWNDWESYNDTGYIISKILILLHCVVDMLHVCACIPRIASAFFELKITQEQCFFLALPGTSGALPGIFLALALGVDILIAIVGGIRYKILQSYGKAYLTLLVFPAVIFTIYIQISSFTKADSRKILSRCNLPIALGRKNFCLYCDISFYMCIILLVIYLIAWFLSKNKLGKYGKSVFNSILVTSLMLIFGWLVTMVVHEISDILELQGSALATTRLFVGHPVNLACSLNVFVYYAISYEHRLAIRSLFGTHQTVTPSGSSTNFFLERTRPRAGTF